MIYLIFEKRNFLIFFSLMFIFLDFHKPIDNNLITNEKSGVKGPMKIIKNFTDKKMVTTKLLKLVVVRKNDSLNEKITQRNKHVNNQNIKKRLTKSKRILKN